MKKRLCVSLALIIFAGLVGYAAMGAKICVAQQQTAGTLMPTVVVVNPMVKMEKKTTVSIVGCGFTPGQEIKLVFNDINAVMTNIGDSLKPALKVNKSGAWYATWTCGRFISRKLIKEGAYVLTVTDSDYNPLAQTPVAFYEAKEKKKK